MNWMVTLMRSIGQGDVLVENAQILQCELMDCYEKSEEEKARPLLEALEEVFRKDTPGIEELLEQTTLYLYTPCLVCGTLSQRCHDLSVAILEIMSQNGPAREVFTGWTDGLSLLLERSSVDEMLSVLESSLRMLPMCIQRIQRKRERFVSIALQLIHKAAKRLLEDCEDLSTSECEPSICAFLQTGRELQGDESGEVVSEETMAFVVLSLSCLLSVMIILQQNCAEGGKSMEQEVTTKLGSLLRALPFPQRPIQESVSHMAEVWNRSEEDEEDVSETQQELRLGCGMLQWAAHQYSTIPRLFTDSDLSVVQMLLTADSSASQAPCILAGLCMIPAAVEKHPLSDVDDLKELCLKLVNHMQLHPLGVIKAQAADRLSLLIQSCTEDIRWQLFKELVFVPFSDIAALVVQQLRHSVVSARNTHSMKSVFASPHVFDLVKKMLREKENMTDVIERAELYSAVLNLYLFLLVRDQAEQSSISGVLERKALEAMKTRLCKIRQHIDASLAQEPDSENRLSRLQHVVDKVLEQLHQML